MDANLRAYVFGAVAVTTVPSASGLLQTLREPEFSWLLAGVFWASIPAAGFLTAWMADSRKILNAALLAIRPGLPVPR